MTNATEKQISYILDLIEKARTNEGKVAAARNNLTGSVMDVKTRYQIDGMLDAHLNIYNEALNAVKWQIENVRDNQQITLDAATASAIIELLKVPMLRNISQISYNAKMEMTVTKLTHEQVLNHNQTGIWVHLPREAAQILVSNEPLSG